jgi:hypothetical protein
LTLFKWLLLPAAVLATISFVVFIFADLEKMKTLRSVAVGALVLACIAAIGAGLLLLYERRRQ